MSALHDAVRKRIAQIHYDIFDNGYSAVHGMDHIMQALAPLLEAGSLMRNQLSDMGIKSNSYEASQWDAAVAGIVGAHRKVSDDSERGNHNDCS